MSKAPLIAREGAPPSVFHIVINSNVNYHKLSMREKYILTKQLIDATNELRENIDEYVKYETPVRNMHMHLEIGPKTGFLHIDGFMVFSGFQHLDLGKIDKLYRENLVGSDKICKNFKIYIRAEGDQTANIISYSKKDGLPIF
jgi:hypothetical protein